MKKEYILKLKELIQKASEYLTDEDALQGIELFPYWQPDTLYEKGARLRYNKKLYRVEQEHTSQENWLPDITPALYTIVAAPGQILPWKQPTGAQDAYMKNDKVYYPEDTTEIWISDIDNNVWEPGIYGWTKM